jgi:hypothetical protein
MSDAMCRCTWTHGGGEVVDNEPARSGVVDDEPARGGIVDDKPARGREVDDERREAESSTTSLHEVE